MNFYVKNVINNIKINLVYGNTTLNTMKRRIIHYIIHYIILLIILWIITKEIVIIVETVINNSKIIKTDGNMKKYVKQKIIIIMN